VTDEEAQRFLRASTGPLPVSPLVSGCTVAVLDLTGLLFPA
jgi:hypothetical protein